MKRRWFLALYISQLGSSLLAVIHIQPIGNLYTQKRQQYGNSNNLEMSVNGGSKKFCHVSKLIGKQFDRYYP